MFLPLLFNTAQHPLAAIRGVLGQEAAADTLFVIRGDTAELFHGGIENLARFGISKVPVRATRTILTTGANPHRNPMWFESLLLGPLVVENLTSDVAAAPGRMGAWRTQLLVGALEEFRSADGSDLLDELGGLHPCRYFGSRFPTRIRAKLEQSSNGFCSEHQRPVIQS